MSDIPQLPSEVSADGREIWDWAERVSSWTQRQDRIRDLRAKIRAMEAECGSCSKWMTGACPKERNVNGRNSGPSCRAATCREFTITGHCSKQLSEARRKLAELEATQ